MKLVGSSEAIRSPEFHRKKKRERALRIALAILGLFVIVVLPVTLLRSQEFLINHAEVGGNTVTSDEEVNKIISERLSGYYLWIIPRSNSIIFSKSKLGEALLAALPRLASAEVTLKDARTLSVTLAERKPHALYCQDTSDLKNPSECFFLDELGYIFSEAPNFSSGVYLVYATLPPLDTPLRSALLSPVDFLKLDKFVKDVVRLGFETEVLVQSGGEYEAFLKSDQTLKWKQEQSLGSLYDNLYSFMQNPDIKKSVRDLLYIDLRFDNKVFYKLKTE